MRVTVQVAIAFGANVAGEHTSVLIVVVVGADSDSAKVFEDPFNAAVIVAD